MSNLKKKLKQLDISKLKMKNGKSVEAEIKRHAGILADCILQKLSEVYDSYTPKQYIRTYDLYNALDVDRTIKINVSSKGAKLRIGLFFYDSVMHESLDGEMMNMAWLINDGYKTNGVFAHIPYFGFREATNFIESGIEKYKKTVSNPFAVKLTKGDEVTYF